MSGEAGQQAPKGTRPRATTSGWRASWRRYRREHKWLRWAIPLAIIVLAFSYPWWGLEGPLSFIFNDGLGIDNGEQGKAVSVCTGLRRPWIEMWTSLRTIS